MLATALWALIWTSYTNRPANPIRTPHVVPQVFPQLGMIHHEFHAYYNPSILQLKIQHLLWSRC